MKIALVIIFNHRFDKNIEKLKKIYENRFSIIRFLVPFYDGEDDRVIPVCESSNCFQGYLMQAYDKLVSLEADYYCFIGDDLLLHPDINEGTIIKDFELTNKEVCISEIGMFNNKNVFCWGHAKKSSIPFFNSYVSWKESICSYENALVKFKTFFNEEYLQNYTKDFFGKAPKMSKYIEHQIQIKKFVLQNGGTLKIPYPLAYGYSDLLIISRNKLYPIARICGIFAAMGLFVEIALPTAIVLTTERNKTSIINKDIHGYKFKALWNKEEKGEIEKSHNNNLSVLYKNWPQNCLFIHPIKLSRWEI